MRRKLIAAAALLVAACAGFASASTLSTVGGIRRMDGALPQDCSLQDGTSLRVAQDEVQDGVYQIWLEHRDETGELVGPALLITVGIVSWAELSCGVEGHALVSWQDYGRDDPGRTFRLVAVDHQSASEFRDSPPNSGSWGGQEFAVWADGYAIAWRRPIADTYEGDLVVQSFRNDGIARHEPVLVSTGPDEWLSGAVVAADRDGNTLVSWEQGLLDNTRQIAAVAVSPDGETSGEPAIVISGGSLKVSNGPEFVVSSDPGTFDLYWYSGLAGSMVQQRLRIEEVAPAPTTTTTTTSTTLDDDRMPDFGPERDLYHEEALPLLQPRLATDGNGTWLASWSGVSGLRDYGFSRVTSISTDSGRRWSKPLFIEYEFVDVISDGAGEWLALTEQRVYSDDDERWNYEIQLLRSTDGASDWHAPRTIASRGRTPAHDCYASVPAMTLGRSRNGTLAVVWSETTICEHWHDGEDQHVYTHAIYAVRSTDDGETWSLPQLLPTGSSTEYGRLQMEPVGPNGWLLLLSGLGTTIGRSDDGGETWTVPPYFGWSSDAKATCDSSDRCILIFADSYQDADYWEYEAAVAIATSDDAGASWSDSRPLTPGEFGWGVRGRSPDIATDGNGWWTAVWSSNRALGDRFGLDADMLASASTDGGETWSTPRPFMDSAANDGWLIDAEAEIAYGAGTWVALWRRSAETNDYYGTLKSEVRLAVANETCGNGLLDGFDQCDDGNRIDGDGCDGNCYWTGCGNGAVTNGEQCDDGNTHDGDSCVSDCAAATCGDGYLRDAVERCDDGNTDDDDACRANCTVARCGDGVVARGLELCDDGNTANEDACPSTCEPATCGDGFLHDGVEDCDDANLNPNDRCTTECRSARCGDGYVWQGVETCDTADPVTAAGCPAGCGGNVCGDANGDGLHTATDSMTILSHAVGKPNVCPMESCDVDGNLTIGATDSLITLGLSVGLTYPTRCDDGPWLVLRLQDPRLLGALQVRTDLSGLPLSLVTRGDRKAPACRAMVDGMLVAAGTTGTSLTIGMIAHQGFSGPADIARCRIALHGDVVPSQFTIAIDDVTTRDGVAVYPSPNVMLRAMKD